ncbi:MAG: hypothetical protein ACYTXF_32170 [Nostoc sp.]
MFHFGIIAGVTGAATVGTFIHSKLQGESTEKAFENSKDVIKQGLKACVFDFSSNK